MRLLPLLLVCACACAAPRAHISGELPQRLDGRTHPVEYDLELTVDPARDRFEGKVSISLSSDGPAYGFWMHARDLVIAAAEIDGQPVTTRAFDRGWLWVSFARPVDGAARLVIRYHAPLPEARGSGLFRQRIGGAWYVFSELWPIEARRVFPCFDEPRWKTPFRVSLRTPEGLVAASNMPIESRAQGVTRFALSPPLPTYLLAFAIGPFDVVEAPGKIPITLYAPAGRGADGDFTVAHTAQVIAALEELLGSPFPYPKLGMVAVPDKRGAMENAGLITYSDHVLLVPAADRTPAWEASWRGFVPHEIAHQWLGDLVTPAWWNELWLSEGLTTWAQGEVDAMLHPSGALARLETRGLAFEDDRLDSARWIRNPIANDDDIISALDSITYSKSAAVLRMLDHWLGAGSLRRGLRVYLARHAHRSAITSELVAALSEAAGRDLAPIVSSFVDRPGIPRLDVKLVCEPTPRLELVQSRFPRRAAEPWQVPVCARTPGGRTCGVLAAKQGRLELAGPCPAWVMANADGTGYYVARYSDELWPRLVEVAGKLAPGEQLSLVQDATLLFEAGELPLGDVVALAGALMTQAPATPIVEGLQKLFAQLEVPAELRDARARLFSRLFGARARALGWQPRRGEPEDDRRLRPILVSWMALEGAEPDLVRDAETAAEVWLRDRRALDPDTAEKVLLVAAGHGDAARFERMLAAARARTQSSDRMSLWVALAGFPDPALRRRAWSLALAELRPPELLRVLYLAHQQPRLRDDAWAVTRDQGAALLARLPGDLHSRFFWLPVYTCDAGQRAAIETWLRALAPRVRGGPDDLRRILESVDRCTERQRRLAPDAAAYFFRRPV